MWETAVTAVVVVALVIALVREIAPPPFLMFGAMVSLIALQALSPEQGLAGFANPGLMTIAALFIVAAGLDRSNALQGLTGLFFGNGAGLRRSLARVLSLSALMSVFTNNTTVVAIFTPVLMRWSKTRRLPVSRFLMPLAFACSLGGLGCLIGTSTNLVVQGLMYQSDIRPMGFFELAWVGGPLLLLGIVYLVLLAPRLLPERADLASSVAESERNYICDVILDSSCKMVGQTVADAGLRHLEGLFLVNIKRRGELIGPVSPRERLEAGDRLIFAGQVETISELQLIPGVLPGYQKHFSLRDQQARLRWFEVVVSYISPLAGKTLRDVEFRTRYQAAVLAVHRPGEELHSKLGDIVFKPGDVLLVEAPERFYQRWARTRDFFLVAALDSAPEQTSHKSWLSLGILLAFVLASTLTSSPVVVNALVAAMLTVATGCLKADEAKDAVLREFGLLILIGSAFAIGKAIETSGLAGLLAHGLTTLSGGLSPLVALAIILLATTVFTELVTNNAAAVIVFPVGLASAEAFGIDARPFAIAVAVGAALAFMTPFGYQTNLMVYGPGRYQFRDYVRLGAPLKLLCLVAAWLLIPLIWPLSAG